MLVDRPSRSRSGDPILVSVTPRQRRAVSFTLAGLLLTAPLVASAACGDASPPRTEALDGHAVPMATAPEPSLAGATPLPRRLWVQPGSPALESAEALRTHHPDDAALLDRLAGVPTAVWLGGWTRDPKKTVSALVSAAAKAGAVPVLVAYNIPDRDCGQHSAGGLAEVESYDKWIGAVAEGIGSREAIVVLEPDSLSVVGCLTDRGLDERLALLRRAVATLSKHERVSVYLDGGHPKSESAATMADRLALAGVDGARGFALNVSNFVSTKDNVEYGEALSQLLGGKHYVIDTSRNGRGSNGDWCNPFGRGLGEEPTTAPGLAHGDAFLWVKRPGESDGTCHGGPAAGEFWPGYALELSRRSWEPKLDAVADGDEPKR